MRLQIHNTVGKILYLAPSSIIDILLKSESSCLEVALMLGKLEEDNNNQQKDGWTHL